jgi:Glycosyl hydrolases family 16
MGRRLALAVALGSLAACSSAAAIDTSGNDSGVPADGGADGVAVDTAAGETSGPVPDGAAADVTGSSDSVVDAPPDVASTGPACGSSIPADAGGDPGRGAPAGYILDWEDLFDTGSTPDPAAWSMYDGAGNGGNGLRRPSAFSIHDGMLDVVAQMESGTLVSGGMAATQSSIGGYFVFRVRSDPDPSNATDAVVLTWPDDGVWPQHGENDMYETGTGTSRDPFNSFVHYGSTPSTQYAFTERADGTQWHVMAMEWTSTRIAFYLDGCLVGTPVTDPNAIPTYSHHVCVQLDAYKTMMGSPVHQFVDWVQVYKTP